MSERLFGYIRVSTKEQNLDRQLVAMRNFGVREELIYQKKTSGKSFDQPEYAKLMRAIRKGDTLVIKSIDRLSRNYDEILEQWRIITKEKEAAIVVLDMPILDTRQGRDLTGTLIADLVLQILSFVAQSERENIRKRQAEGIAAAKAKGVRFGRPEISAPEDFQVIISAWEDKTILFSEALRRSGLSEATFYRRLRTLRAKEEK